MLRNVLHLMFPHELLLQIIHIKYHQHLTNCFCNTYYISIIKIYYAYLAISIYELYFTFPFIFFIDGKVNLFKWNTNILGNLLNSLFILAFECYLHFSHLYLSFESRVSSFKKFEMHLSRVDS